MDQKEAMKIRDEEIKKAMLEYDRIAGIAWAERTKAIDAAEKKYLAAMG